MAQWRALIVKVINIKFIQFIQFIQLDVCKKLTVMNNLVPLKDGVYLCGWLTTFEQLFLWV
jgi:hypothetical protein